MEVASTLSDESSRSPAASLVPFATKGSLLKRDVRNRGSSSALITRTIACKLEIQVILRLRLPDEPLQAYSMTTNRANGGGPVKATGPASAFDPPAAVSKVPINRHHRQHPPIQFYGARCIRVSHYGTRRKATLSRMDLKWGSLVEIRILLTWTMRYISRLSVGRLSGDPECGPIGDENEDRSAIRSRTVHSCVGERHGRSHHSLTERA
jgi:hypothetical protein